MFTDCLVLLLILSNWGHSYFWPDPGDVVHFDMIFPLIQKLRGWSKKIIFIKVKSHAGCFFNKMADERARKVASPMLLQYSLGPRQWPVGSDFVARFCTRTTCKKCDKNHIPWATAYWAQQIWLTLTLHKSLILLAISMTFFLALILCNTVFTGEVQVQHHGAVVSNVIASCRDSLVPYWMEAMTQTPAVAKYLHTINLIKYSFLRPSLLSM